MLRFWTAQDAAKWMRALNLAVWRSLTLDLLCVWNACEPCDLGAKQIGRDEWLRLVGH